MSKINVILKYVIQKIVQDEWKENTKIPSERFFEIKFNVSNNIVKKALTRLSNMNLIYSKERIGNFVQTKDLITIFRRESETDGCSSSRVIFEDVQSFFKLKEIKEEIPAQKIIQPIKLPYKTFSYVKLYFADSGSHKTRKISFSYINEILLPKKDFNKNIFLHQNLLKENNIPCTKIRFTTFTNDCSLAIRETLGIKLHKGVILKYVVLLNEDNKIIHAAKIYINHKYFSTLAVYHL